MLTINISLPDKLKSQAETLVESGYYASFSDLVRDSLRRLIKVTEYDLLADEAKRDLKKGKAVVLDSNKDVDDYLESI